MSQSGNGLGAAAGVGSLVLAAAVGRLLSTMGVSAPPDGINPNGTRSSPRRVEVPPGNGAGQSSGEKANVAPHAQNDAPPAAAKPEPGPAKAEEPAGMPSINGKGRLKDEPRERASASSDAQRALTRDYRALAQRLLIWPVGDVRVERDRAEIHRIGTALKAENLGLHAKEKLRPAASDGPWPLALACVERQLETQRYILASSRDGSRSNQWATEKFAELEALLRTARNAPEQLTPSQLQLLRLAAGDLRTGQAREVQRWHNPDAYLSEEIKFPPMDGATREELSFVQQATQARLERLDEEKKKLAAIDWEVADLALRTASNEALE